MRGLLLWVVLWPASLVATAWLVLELPKAVRWWRMIRKGRAW